MPIQPVKGTHDLYAAEADKLRYLENTLSGLAELYGYREIVTPVFEYTEVFSRGTGEGSDVVRKEMYTFEDRGGRSLTLRPEFTAAIARSVISNRYYATSDMPFKVFYQGPLFRYERPQLGRYRQFHQFGVEAIGEDSARLDAETILLAVQCLSYLGFKNIELSVNSLGDEESRKNYREALREYFGKHIDEMCEDCKDRLRLNPLRILDCKVESDHLLAEKAPKISDYLSEESEKRYYETLSILNDYGINYVKDERLVRGLDYYSEIVFEVRAKAPSGKDYGALLGGGHYASLLKELGGPDLPGVGFALGLERVIAVMEEEGLFEGLEGGLDLYVMPIGENMMEEAAHLAEECRMYGYKTEMPMKAGKLGSLFKKAEKRGAKFALILGEEEWNEGKINIKDLLHETQKTIALEDLEMELEEALSPEEEHHHCHCECCEDDECECHEHHHDEGTCCSHKEEKEGK